MWICHVTHTQTEHVAFLWKIHAQTNAQRKNWSWYQVMMSWSWCFYKEKEETDSRFIHFSQEFHGSIQELKLYHGSFHSYLGMSDGTASEEAEIKDFREPIDPDQHLAVCLRFYTICVFCSSAHIELQHICCQVVWMVWSFYLYPKCQKNQASFEKNKCHKFIQQN